MIYLELFYTFFKIGLFTFGGGYAMIPLIKQEIIGKGWMTEDLMLKFLAVSESTPGSFAVNISTFIGEAKGGILGAIMATLGVVLPSFIIILIVYQFYKRFITNRYVLAFMDGIRAVVVGLILSVALDLIISSFIPSFDNFKLDYPTIIIFGIIFLISFGYKKIFKRGMSPILLILISAVIGILTYGVVLKYFL